MKIEWASSFLSDGTRIEPPPSKMHGWIVKMRGTLLGDEKVRTAGMREMQRAQHERKKWDEWRQRQEKYRGGQTPKNKGLLSLFTFGKNKKKAPAPRRLQSSRQPGSTRPSYHSSNSHGSRAVKPTPKSGGQTSRSASRPQSERRPTNQSHRSTHRSSHRR